MNSLLVALAIWGVPGVVIGLLLGGVGVVPVAMLATLTHGMWEPLAELAGLVVLTFGSGILGLWLWETLSAPIASPASEY